MKYNTNVDRGTDRQMISKQRQEGNQRNSIKAGSNFKCRHIYIDVL